MPSISERHDRLSNAIKARYSLLDQLAALGLNAENASGVSVAVIDGAVDLSHPCFDGARLFEEDNPWRGGTGADAFHGTAVASVLFGQPASIAPGICHASEGRVIPLFRDRAKSSDPPCSQQDLANAIVLAVHRGAKLINISGGEFIGSSEPESALVHALRLCVSERVLVVAAAGNDGCRCLHVPAAMPHVLAVGASVGDGEVASFSNWAHGADGILASGVRVLVATPGGGLSAESGTSFAAAIVTGVAALLMGAQVARGQRPDPFVIRAALLDGAVACVPAPDVDCAPYLRGRLDVARSVALLRAHGGESSRKLVGAAGKHTLSHSTTLREHIAMDPKDANQEAPSQESAIAPARDAPGMTGGASALTLSGANSSECNCNQQKAPPSIVYAIGSLGYSFRTEARKDSITQRMGQGNAGDLRQLLTYLRTSPHDAANVIWTLNLELMPIYAIAPIGPFAHTVYERLREFAEQQLEDKIQRLSVAGVSTGTMKLLNGHQVPVLLPELAGMYSWSTTALVDAVLGKTSEASTPTTDIEKRRAGVHGFLERIYFELRNLGIHARDRAMNFAATNAYQVEKVFAAAVADGMELDALGVERSPVCRPASDCWDVTMTFFDPTRRTERARRVYRFAVDVSDVVPVTVGAVRSWSVH